ncbi:MAG: helix-turn-helix transcriptional regulator [Bryobacterales bacterium]|nr:helix-turn-helix transcriptional regulator [Bryobacterales bacterium]
MPFRADAKLADLGAANTVLRATGRRHFVNDFPGPLSVKAVMDGSVTWSTEDGEFVVNEASLLVLNEGQPYSMRIDEPCPVRTCCLFFERGYVERVRHAMVSECGACLDDPDAGPEHRFGVRLEQGGALLSRIRKMDVARDEEWLEEQMLAAAREVVLLDQQSRVLVARVPAAKYSTRVETLRRLQRAREYLHASANERIDLDAVAREACLSPYHLHRAFRQTFRETPHGYLTRLRLNRAFHALENGHAVTEVCLDCGFASVGTFSTLFRRRFGVPPSDVIANSARSKKQSR